MPEDADAQDERPRPEAASTDAPAPAADAIILLDDRACILRWNRTAAIMFDSPVGAGSRLCLTDLPRYRDLVPGAVRARIESPPSEGTWRGETPQVGAAERTGGLEFSITDFGEGEPGSASRLVVIRALAPAHREERAHPTGPGLDPIPLCAHCKSVGDGRGAWQTIEIYLTERSGAALRQEMCPVCVRAMYPELCQERQPSVQATEAV